jgi:uncharacterized protein with PQ loop repeat
MSERGDVVGLLFGSVGAACFALMLVPQAALNHRRASTAGLSLALVVLWHSAAVLYLSYMTHMHGSTWLLLSMSSFSVVSALIEAQVLAYSGRGPRTILPMALSFAALSLGFGFGLGRVLGMLPDAVVFAVGTVCPALLFSVGFLPQFAEFLSTLSIEGYSFTVTALDVLGSAANTVVVFRDEGLVPAAWLGAAPFIAIIALHAVLLCIAAGIVLLVRRARPTVGERKVSWHSEVGAGRQGADPSRTPSRPPPAAQLL